MDNYITKKAGTQKQEMQSQKKQYKQQTNKAILPMTINQITHSLEREDQFEYQNFHTLSIVARLESFRKEARHNIMIFNDGTGSIEGQINTQDGKMPSYAQGFNFEQKQGYYFFVVIKPKFTDDSRKKYFVHMIKQVKDYNYITKHTSDIILSHLFRKKN